MDDLYNFREHYFETHSVEEAGRKQNDVAQEMEKTLKKLEEKESKGYIYTKALGPFNFQNLIHTRCTSMLTNTHRSVKTQSRVPAAEGQVPERVT